MKDYVYFFKHINVPGIKIGKASGESVEARFSAFKTFSPYGAQNLGYYETQNGLQEEKRLHDKYAHKRMQGEFFDITELDVEAELKQAIPNYLLLLSEMQEKGITLQDIQDYTKRKKHYIHKITDPFDILLNKLPVKFTPSHAISIAKELGMPARTFEVGVRAVKNMNKVRKIGHGLYLKN
jgi:hypothetical protein